MKIDFRQGIIRYQTDQQSQQPEFLQKSNGGASIDLIAQQSPTEVAIACGDADYLVSEAKNTINAFTGFVAGQDYWLYIDIDELTAARTFDSTTLQPFTGANPPTNAFIDQHWFDTTTTTTRVWNGVTWVQKLRVFLAKYDEGSIIEPFPLGTQVGINQEVTLGHILFDEDETPVRSFKRRGLGKFLTTSTNFLTHTSKSANISFETAVRVARASQTIPGYSVVAFDSNQNLKLASYNDLVDQAVGIVVDDLNTDEIGNYITTGYITHTGWNWTQAPGTPLFVGVTGEITTTIPQSGSVQKIGVVISPQEIYLDIQDQQLYDASNFQNLVISAFDKVTGKKVLTANNGNGNGNGNNNCSLNVCGYQHIQAIPSDIWTVGHNLNTSAVTVQVYVGDQVVFPSEINVIDVNTIEVNFGPAFLEVGHVNIVSLE